MYLSLRDRLMAVIFLKSWFAAHSQSSYLPFFISIALSVTIHLLALFYPASNFVSSMHSESENSSITISVKLMPVNKFEKETENNMGRKAINKFNKPVLTSIVSNKQTALHEKIANNKLNMPIHNNKSNTLKKLDTKKNDFDIITELKELNRIHNQQFSLTGTTSTVNHNKISVKHDLKQAPNLEFSIAPEFPSEARWESRTGSTIIKYRITLLGHVTDIKIKRTSGHQDFDSSAIYAIKQWRYKQNNINPLNWYQYSFHFKLE